MRVHNAAAVTDPAAAGFDGEENITGTSDALNTDAIMNLIVAANPGIDTEHDYTIWATIFRRTKS